MKREHREEGRGSGFAKSLLLLQIALLTGCARNFQSALDPAGPAAQEISRLWWFLLAVCGVVFVVTMVLLFYAVFRGRQEKPSPPLGGTRFVIVSGIVFPTLILIGMLIYSLRATGVLRMRAADVVIEVTGHQFWWEVVYPELGIVTANEMYIPVGEPVRLRLTSADVIHSFWVPNLHGKMDLFPEHANEFWIEAERAGAYRGQCAEYCGVQHALMAFHVLAVPREEFDAWVARRQTPQADPSEPRLVEGRKVFFDAGCNACHSIGATEAEVPIGPDLTLIGSRKTVGGGILPNTRENLGRWITNPQALKPGNEMPPTQLEPAQLHALLDYLESLK